MKCQRDYLRDLAGRVWNDQVSALSYGNELLLHEPTLTENILLQMAKDKLDVRMFSSRKEGLEGADWEWHVIIGQQNLAFRIQAKRLDGRGANEKLKKGNYPELKLKGEQVKKLISSARRSGTIPIYIFYNHGRVSNPKSLWKRHSIKDRGYNRVSFWGCSIALAFFVKNAQNNCLKTLIEMMHPWHHLVEQCCYPGRKCKKKKCSKKCGWFGRVLLENKAEKRKGKELIKLIGEQVKDLFGEMDSENENSYSWLFKIFHGLIGKKEGTSSEEWEWEEWEEVIKKIFEVKGREEVSSNGEEGTERRWVELIDRLPLESSVDRKLKLRDKNIEEIQSTAEVRKEIQKYLEEQELAGVAKLNFSQPDS